MKKHIFLNINYRILYSEKKKKIYVIVEQHSSYKAVFSFLRPRQGGFLRFSFYGRIETGNFCFLQGVYWLLIRSLSLSQFCDHTWLEHACHCREIASQTAVALHCDI